MATPSRIDLVERADRAIATAKILIAKIRRTVAPVSEPDFDQFDANIAEAERVLTLARECGFSDLVEMLQKNIAAMLLPDITILLANTDGQRRARVAATHKQLREMLGVVEDR